MEGEEEGNRKRSKKEVVAVEEEVVYDIDGRYEEYLYERWIWGSMQENRFSFLGCVYVVLVSSAKRKIVATL